MIEIKQGENITVEKKDFEKSIFLLTDRPHRKKKYMDIHSISFSFEFCIDLNQIKKMSKKKKHL